MEDEENTIPEDPIIEVRNSSAHLSEVLKSTDQTIVVDVADNLTA